MEPILPEPQGYSQEQSPQGGSVVDPNILPEVKPSIGQEGTHERMPAPAAGAPLQPPSVPSAPPLQPVAQPLPTSDNTASASPSIADDVDVIEKEWVDKAKKIVSATKEDPHMQEKEVSKLQADYLLKRYNKQVKLAD